jgi:RNA polymerase sigma factor (sigma-70 family)
MSPDISVTEWITSLKGADAEAAQKLWERYSERLLQLASRKMRDAPKGISDEEDIAQSVFRNVCRGAAAGRFGDVRNRDDLWWLLVAITKQKVVDHIRRESAQKRGASRVRTESALSGRQRDDRRFSLDYLVGREPTPEFLAMFDEEVSRLLALLRDDRLRQIALQRIEGYTATEISAQMGISPRSVERKLKLIRVSWSRQYVSIYA